MTVMSAADTGTVNQTPEVDAIHDQVAPSVWTLMGAGQMEAAMLLVQANAGRFYEAWRKEFTGIAMPATVVRDVAGCTSPDHDGLDCASALASGQLAEGVEFCNHCSAQQRDMEPAPAMVSEAGTLVHIVTKQEIPWAS